jgi:hypothetical protein
MAIRQAGRQEHGGYDRRKLDLSLAPELDLAPDLD